MDFQVLRLGRFQHRDYHHFWEVLEKVETVQVPDLAELAANDCTDYPVLQFGICQRLDYFHFSEVYFRGKIVAQR